MNVPSVAQMIPVLQTAIGPMILISGLGLILLTTTNRLGRTSDRVRILTALLPTVTESKHAKISAQLAILWRRARALSGWRSCFRHPVFVYFQKSLSSESSIR